MQVEQRLPKLHLSTKPGNDIDASHGVALVSLGGSLAALGGAPSIIVEFRSCVFHYFSGSRFSVEMCGLQQ